LNNTTMRLAILALVVLLALLPTDAAAQGKRAIAASIQGEGDDGVDVDIEGVRLKSGGSGRGWGVVISKHPRDNIATSPRAFWRDAHFAK
jgi:hypothetical protein